MASNFVTMISLFLVLMFLRRARSVNDNRAHSPLPASISYSSASSSVSIISFPDSHQQSQIYRPTTAPFKAVSDSKLYFLRKSRSVTDDPIKCVERVSSSEEDSDDGSVDVRIGKDEKGVPVEMIRLATLRTESKRSVVAASKPPHRPSPVRVIVHRPVTPRPRPSKTTTTASTTSSTPVTKPFPSSTQEAPARGLPNDSPGLFAGASNLKNPFFGLEPEKPSVPAISAVPAHGQVRPVVHYTSKPASNLHHYLHLHSDDGQPMTIPLDNIHLHFNECSVASLHLPTGYKLTIQQLFYMFASEAVFQNNYDYLFKPLDSYVERLAPKLADRFIHEFELRLSLYMMGSAEFQRRVILFALERASRADAGFLPEDLSMFAKQLLERLRPDNYELFSATISDLVIHNTKDSLSRKLLSHLKRLSTEEVLESPPSADAMHYAPFVKRSFISATEYYVALTRSDPDTLDKLMHAINERIRYLDPPYKQHFTIRRSKSIIREPFIVRSTSFYTLHQLYGLTILMSMDDMLTAFFSLYINNPEMFIGRMNNDVNNYYYYPSYSA